MPQNQKLTSKPEVWEMEAEEPASGVLSTHLRQNKSKQNFSVEHSCLLVSFPPSARD